jgi:hypothetical protein
MTERFGFSCYAPPIIGFDGSSAAATPRPFQRAIEKTIDYSQSTPRSKTGLRHRNECESQTLGVIGDRHKIQRTAQLHTFTGSDD